MSDRLIMAIALTVMSAGLLALWNVPWMGFNGWDIWTGGSFVIMVVAHVAIVAAVIHSWWMVFYGEDDE